MPCSNCYSGCREISSDKCIKYTGTDISVLGIENGDSVNYVVAALIEFLVSTLDGTGIKYELDAGSLCTLVSDELSACDDITVVDITNNALPEPKNKTLQRHGVEIGDSNELLEIRFIIADRRKDW